MPHVEENLKLLSSQPCPVLGQGWSKETYLRMQGMLSGKEQIAYKSPLGNIYFNKADLVQSYASQVAKDISSMVIDWISFDFQTGKSDSAISKMRSSKQGFYTQDEMQNYVKPPVRQTAVCIFQQPVNSKSTCEPCDVRFQDGKLKPGLAGRPGKLSQLLWFRRLQEDKTTPEQPSLPYGLESAHSIASSEAAAYSLISSLVNHTNVLLVGQTHAGTKMEEDPTVYWSVNQPCIKPAKVRIDLIETQTKIVKKYREELVKVLKELEQMDTDEKDKIVMELKKKMDIEAEIEEAILRNNVKDEAFEQTKHNISDVLDSEEQKSPLKRMKTEEISNGLTKEAEIEENLISNDQTEVACPELSDDSKATINDVTSSPSKNMVEPNPSITNGSSESKAVENTTDADMQDLTTIPCKIDPIESHITPVLKTPEESMQVD